MWNAISGLTDQVVKTAKVAQEKWENSLDNGNLEEADDSDNLDENSTLFGEENSSTTEGESALQMASTPLTKRFGLSALGEFFSGGERHTKDSVFRKGDAEAVKYKTFDIEKLREIASKADQQYRGVLDHLNQQIGTDQKEIEKLKEEYIILSEQFATLTALLAEDVNVCKQKLNESGLEPSEDNVEQLELTSAEIQCAKLQMMLEMEKREKEKLRQQLEEITENGESVNINHNPVNHPQPGTPSASLFPMGYPRTPSSAPRSTVEINSLRKQIQDLRDMLANNMVDSEKQRNILKETYERELQLEKQKYEIVENELRQKLSMEALRGEELAEKLKIILEHQANGNDGSFESRLMELRRLEKEKYEIEIRGNRTVIQTQEERINLLNQKLSQLENDNQKFIEEFRLETNKLKESHMRQITSMKSHYDQEIQTLLSLGDEEEKKVVEAEEKSIRVKAQISAKDVEINQLKSELSRIKQSTTTLEVQRLKDINSRLLQNINASRRKVVELEKERNKLGASPLPVDAASASASPALKNLMLHNDELEVKLLELEEKYSSTKNELQTTKQILDDTLSQLNQQTSKLTAAISSLENDQHVVELEQLQKKLAQKDAKIEALTKTVEDQQVQFATAKAQFHGDISTLEDKLASSISEFDQSRREKANEFALEIEKLQAELEKQRNLAAQSADQCNILREQNATILKSQQDLPETHNQVTLQNQLEATLKENAHLWSETQRYISTIEILNSKLKELEDSSTSNEQTSQATFKLEQDLQSVLQEREQAVSSLESALQEVSTLSSQVSAMKEQQLQSQQENVSLEKTIAAERQKIQQLETAVSCYKSEHQTLLENQDAEKAVLKQENSQLQYTLKRLQEQLEENVSVEAERSNLQLQQQLNQLKEKLNATEFSFSENNGKVENLELQLREKLLQIAEMEKSSAMLESKLKIAEQTLDDRENELQSHISELQNSDLEARQKIVSLQHQVQALTAAKDVAVQKVQSLTEEMNSIQQSFGGTPQLSELVAKLQSENEQLSKQCELLMADVNQSTMERVAHQQKEEFLNSNLNSIREQEQTVKLKLEALTLQLAETEKIHEEKLNAISEKLLQTVKQRDDAINDSERIRTKANEDFAEMLRRHQRESGETKLHEESALEQARAKMQELEVVLETEKQKHAEELQKLAETFAADKAAFEQRFSQLIEEKNRIEEHLTASKLEKATEIAKLNVEIKKSEISTKMAVGQRVKLDLELTKLKIQLEQAEAKLQSSIEDCKKIAEECNNLKTVVLARLIKEKEQLELKTMEMEDKIITLESASQNQKSAYHKDLQDLEKEKVEVETLKIEMEETKNQMNKRVRELENELKETKDRTAHLQSQLESVNLEKKVTSQELSALVEEKSKIEIALEAASESLHKKAADLESLQQIYDAAISRKEGEEHSVEELQANNAKLTRTLEQLQQHLQESEQAHTEQIIDFDTKLANQSLQIQLLMTEVDEARRSEENAKSAALMAAKLQKEKDDALRENDSLQESVANLHGLLEQERAAREDKIRAKVLLMEEELQKARLIAEEYQILATESEELKKKLSQTESMMRESQGSLLIKTRDCIILQEQLATLKRALEESMQRLTSITESSEAVVDKRIITKLLITYFAGKSNKQEVLELMARILGFSDKEKEEIGLIKPVRGWFAFLGGAANTLSVKTDAGPKNITDLWVEFLLKETASIEQNNVKTETNDGPKQPESDAVPTPNPQT